jgi:acyl-CoA synthetase (AMP-forming)/AMP-acid ligase II
MTNLARLLSDAVAEHPDRIAVRLDDIALPYAVVDQAVARTAGMLAAEGIEAGDRVGIMLPNVPYFPFAFYGALRLGATVVPMNRCSSGGRSPSTSRTPARSCCWPGTASPRRPSRARRTPARPASPSSPASSRSASAAPSPSRS